MTMLRPTFRNPALEAEFQEKGFVRVPFLSKEQVQEVIAAWKRLKEQSHGLLTQEDLGGEGKAPIISYDFTFIDKNPAFKHAVFDYLSAYYQPIYSKLLQDFRPIIANYIFKDPNDGEVPVHQNWAFVDEDVCTSVSIWVPLVDSTAENGTLSVIPGSHKRFGRHRGPMVPWELNHLVPKLISDYLEPLETQAGDAVILDDSLIHYSAPNQTEDFRLTTQLIVVPEEKACVHYHLNPHEDSSLIHKLEVDQSFFMQFHPWKLPAESTRRVCELPFADVPLNEEQFLAQLNGPRFDGFGAEAGQPAVAQKPVSPTAQVTGQDVAVQEVPPTTSSKGFWTQAKRLLGLN